MANLKAALSTSFLWELLGCSCMYAKYVSREFCDFTAANFARRAVDLPSLQLPFSKRARDGSLVDSVFLRGLGERDLRLEYVDADEISKHRDLRVYLCHFLIEL
ncbi:MAG: hypothetical protein IH969_09065 [Candidatus Krumholzibacteriota bacterium]|nr:hypothetical protein [Candidatus Krumholzibacteriota bacterium]